MPLMNPLFAHSAAATFVDARRDLEGFVVRNAAGVMRAGVFPDHLNPLVTGRSDMKVNIADFRAVQNRGGAVPLANVGTDTSVTLPAAPGANKRIDLVYETARSSNAPWSDGAGNDTPIFGFVQGTASATPVAPSLPANLSTAIPLATVEIPAGATTTLSAGVVITQVYPYTALAGGTVVVRNSVELGAWAPADGARAYCIADNSEYVRIGGQWKGDLPDTDWVYPSTTGGTNHPTRPIRYRRIKGVLYLGGLWTPTSDNQTAFTLPNNFRPDEDVYCWLDRTAQVRGILQADGQVRFVGPGGTGAIQWATAPRVTVARV